MPPPEEGHGLNPNLVHESKLKNRLEKALGSVLDGLPDGALERFETLDALVSRWGRAIRLVGFKTQLERDQRYFAEALAVMNWLPSEGAALDIGSGGGSPALPLAIARPALKWTLVEANERKALFLEEAIRALKLDNVTVVQTRFQSLAPTAPFDVVTVRGVALARGTLEKVGVDLAAKGRFLWISSEAVLTTGRADLERSWAQCRGPTRLLREGGYLLVADARA